VQQGICVVPTKQGLHDVRTFPGAGPAVLGGLTPAEPFTVSVWFRTRSLTRNQAIVGNYVGCSYEPKGFLLVLYYIDGRALLNLYNGGKAAISVPAPLNDGGWHHAAAVFDDGVYALYIDGQLADSKSGAYGVTDQPVMVGDAAAATQQCGQFGFMGDIGDVEFFQGAMAASEIATLYRTRQP
jgi:hypothetical protein